MNKGKCVYGVDQDCPIYQEFYDKVSDKHQFYAILPKYCANCPIAPKTKKTHVFLKAKDLDLSNLDLDSLKTNLKKLEKLIEHKLTEAETE